MFRIEIKIVALLFVLFFTSQTLVIAQSTKGIDIEDPVSEVYNNIKLSFGLNNSNWTYSIGEEAVFEFEISNDGVLLSDVELSYTIGPEKMPAVKKGMLIAENGKAIIVGDSMDEPGFLRCDVHVKIDNKSYYATATAAYDPDKIKPTATRPSDFLRFWETAIAESKNIPLNPILTPMPLLSTDEVEVYHIEYQFLTQKVRKFYGVLSIPKEKDTYPAIIRFPGAGWAPSSGDQIRAVEGFITLNLFIHEHPANKQLEYYEKLQEEELKDYMYKGMSNRDSFYFKDVILGCVRSVDFLHTLDKYDGKNLGVWGSSQGGALSIMTTSLESRINYYVALCPGMSDFTGYLHGRAGGWPHYFLKKMSNLDLEGGAFITLSYYDVANFAGNIQVPGYYSWGFNDQTTPPTSFYATYNQVKSKKELFVIPEGIHKIYPKQIEKTYTWLKNNLTNNR